MLIDFYPCQSHCYAFGGFEVQCLDLMESLSVVGAKCGKHDYWQRYNECKIAHFFGTGVSHSDEIRWASRSGKRLVATALFDYCDTFYKRLRNFGGTWLGATGVVKENIKMLDALCVVNEAQLEVAVKFYGASRSLVHVIPNIVPDIFFNKSGSFIEQNSVVCIGSICRRKNQLRLIEAIESLDCYLTIIGKPLEGEESYFDLVKKAAALSGKVRIVPWLDRNSMDYVSLLGSSRILVLPSQAEVQPIVALEMGVLGKQIILSDRPYAYQKIYEGCGLCDPDSVSSISQAILRAIDDRRVAMLSEGNLSACRSLSVATKQMDCYKSLF